MKSRRSFFVLIAAYFAGTSSFSQILNGKYVFKNETCITGYSTHIFKDTELADARAASSMMLQQILNDWSVNLNSQVAIYDNIDALKKDILEKKIDIFALTTPEYFMLRNQVNATPFLTYHLYTQRPRNASKEADQFQKSAFLPKIVQNPIFRASGIPQSPSSTR